MPKLSYTKKTVIFIEFLIRVADEHIILFIQNVQKQKNMFIDNTFICKIIHV